MTTRSSIDTIVKSIIPSIFMKSYKTIECNGTVLINVELALWIILVPPLWFLWWWFRRQINKKVEAVRPAGVRVVVSVE